MIRRQCLEAAPHVATSIDRSSSISATTLYIRLDMNVVKLRNFLHASFGQIQGLRHPKMILIQRQIKTLMQRQIRTRGDNTMPLEQPWMQKGGRGACP